MWVKRSNEELAKFKAEANRVRFWLAVVAGVFFGLISLFFHGKGWVRNHPTNSVPLDEIFERIPAALLVGLLSGSFLYRFAPKRRRMMICLLCERTKSEDADCKCSCGGDLEDLETMKWVDYKSSK